MSYTKRIRLTAAAALTSLICIGTTAAGHLQVIRIMPASAWHRPATLTIAVVGSGFQDNSAIRFLVAGTDKLGGIRVNRVRYLSPQELVALVNVEQSVVPGEFDVEIQDANGGVTRAKKAFVIEPYSWSERFGCSGAESWRRQIPCRRGVVD
jgi:hypothetical protein